MAKEIGGSAILLTLDPHPIQLLRPEMAPPVLTTVEQRAALLQSLGADHVIILQTNMDFLQLSPEQFFLDVLRQRLQAQALVEGVNFGFGRDRSGNIDTLQDLCNKHNCQLAIVPPVEIEGEAVSSSRIRQLLLQGDVVSAKRLLGRPYFIEGVVIEGEKRGRSLGFPTANLGNVQQLIPQNGVYAVQARIGVEERIGAANIGPNPTFGVEEQKIEVHLLDYSKEIYGHQLSVSFLERLRSTRPFQSKEDLIQQLQTDIEAARAIGTAPDAG